MYCVVIFLTAKKGFFPPIAGAEWEELAALDADTVTRIASDPSHRDTAVVYSLAPGYVLRDFFGESIVVPIGSMDSTASQTSVLNEVGGFLWGLLSEGKSFAELLAALLAEYDTTVSVAAKDIFDFLTSLSKDSYLVF